MTSPLAPTRLAFHRVLPFLALALVFGPLTSQSHAVANIGFNLDLEYNTRQDDPFYDGYAAFAGLGAVDHSLPTKTGLYSPNAVPGGSGAGFSSELGAGELAAGGDSLVFGGFTAFKNELDSTGWTVRLDVDGATPTDYTFDVDASAVTDFAAVPVVISGGISGSTYAEGSTPTFTWTGPSSGFDAVELRLELMNGPTDSASPGINATSFSFATPLAPGTYFLRVIYSKDVTAGNLVVASFPLDAQSNPLPDWAGLQEVQIRVSDRVSFNVVPEPSVFVALAGGIAILALQRRRRFRAAR